MDRYDIIIIGAGPGGYETALYAKENGFSVLLIEKDKLGGTCLNAGCIPTKTYNAIAKEIHEFSKLTESGIEVNYTFDFKKAHERKNAVVSELTNGISFLLKKQGVDLVIGEAKLVDKNTVSVNDENYSADNIIIATGSSNLDTIIPGSKKVMDAKDILDIEEVPESLAIIGGGVIGVEMATIFNAYGSSVTIYEGMDTILPNIDKEISRRLSSFLTRSGVKINTKTMVKELDTNKVTFEKNGNIETLEYSKVLLSIGRIPNINGLGLDEIGINYTRKGIVVNENYQTNIPNIYAIGDCNGKIMLAHYAEFSGKQVINHLLGKTVNDYPCPGAIFTIPEVATVGVTEEELKEKQIEYKVNKVMYRSNGKALAMNETDGFIKTLLVDGKLVGCHIIGYDASTLIHEAVLLINTKCDTGVAKGFIYAHPTLSEVFKNSL